jgi:uncharacterized protein (DUF305 family)
MRRIIPLLVSLILFAAACGGQKGPERAAGNNDADVTFATGMIAHHEQAIEMSRLASQRATNQEVKNLALRIEQAQGPEIETMKGFLSKWGESSEKKGMEGHDMGPGMMTEEQMQELEQASGPTFDRLFLEGMIEHHKGAISMADEELKQGESAEAKDLAGRIKSDQEKEVKEMEALLGQVA